MSKKITIIISQIEHTGGFARILSSLQKEDFDLECILINRNEDTEFKYFLDSKKIKNKFIKFEKKANYPIVFFKLIVFLILRRPQVVHTHMRDADILGQIAAYILIIKNRIYTRHSSTFNHMFFPDAVKWDKLVNRLSTHIISISKATKSILIKEGVSLKKITDIEHGFDLEKFKNVREEHVVSLKNRYGLNGYDPIIGVISRQIEWKGIQYIIPAFKEFLKSYPNSKLVLANAIGDYKKEIQKLLKDLPEGSYVEIEFESDVVSLYKSFDCFIHVPIDSEVEAFGQIYVESLAAGVPSIFTKSGIANDFCIDKFNCLIVDYKNSNEIYNALINIFENTNFRDEMTKNGLLSIEKFNFEDFYKKIKELYTLLIK